MNLKRKNMHHRSFQSSIIDFKIDFSGLLGIAPTRNCTNSHKIGFIVAGGGFYSYYIHQGNKSDKGRKIVRIKVTFYAYRKI